MNVLAKKSYSFIALLFLFISSASLQAFTPHLNRCKAPRTLTLQPGSINSETYPSFGNTGPPSEFVNTITQQEGLRICFYELEVDVRNCQYAFQNNIPGYNRMHHEGGRSSHELFNLGAKAPG